MFKILQFLIFISLIGHRGSSCLYERSMKKKKERKDVWNCVLKTTVDAIYPIWTSLETLFY